MPYAFRCASCNSLAESAHAGERERPAKCATCGAGVTFTPDGIKSYDDANWIVLDDLDDDDLDEVLSYHSLTPDDVEAHVPTEAASPDHEPTSIDVAAVDVVGGKDKVAR